MKHGFMIVLLLSVVMLFGCQTAKKENVEEQGSRESLQPKDMAEDFPEVRAFQDEFTREFLQSTKASRPGYYPFLSGTGAFEMDFPAEGKLGEKSYHIRDKSYEVLLIDVGDEASNIIHQITIHYYSHLEEELHKKSRLGQLQSSVGEDLNFERINWDHQVAYIAKLVSDKEEASIENYGYAALIFNQQDLGGIDLIYETICLENCEKDRQEDEAEMYDWMKSIQFLELSSEKDEDDS